MDLRPISAILLGVTVVFHVTGCLTCHWEHGLDYKNREYHRSLLITYLCTYTCPVTQKCLKWKDSINDHLATLVAVLMQLVFCGLSAMCGLMIAEFLLGQERSLGMWMVVTSSCTGLIGLFGIVVYTNNVSSIANLHFSFAMCLTASVLCLIIARMLYVDWINHPPISESKRTYTPIYTTPNGSRSRGYFYIQWVLVQFKRVRQAVHRDNADGNNGFGRGKEADHDHRRKTYHRNYDGNKIIGRDGGCGYGILHNRGRETCENKGYARDDDIARNHGNRRPRGRETYNSNKH